MVKLHPLKHMRVFRHLLITICRTTMLNLSQSTKKLSIRGGCGGGRWWIDPRFSVSSVVDTFPWSLAWDSHFSRHLKSKLEVEISHKWFPPKIDPRFSVSSVVDTFPWSLAWDSHFSRHLKSKLEVEISHKWFPPKDWKIVCFKYNEDVRPYLKLFGVFRLLSMVEIFDCNFGQRYLRNK